MRIQIYGDSYESQNMVYCKQVFDLLLSAETYQYKMSMDCFEYIVGYCCDWLEKPRLSDDQLERKYKICQFQ